MFFIVDHALKAEIFLPDPEDQGNKSARSNCHDHQLVELASYIRCSFANPVWLVIYALWEFVEC
jgi:hypothetical protein